ncbi:hypothetical protein CF54_10365 [Streptomyces sp. Tu 6176]|nr:hypothetical protein CF54_10365 [Streptomyces sp. Tu 6176]
MAELHPAAPAEFRVRDTLSASTLMAALREPTRTGGGAVVLCGSAYRNRGIESLLDAVAVCLPYGARTTARSRRGRPTRRRRSTARPRRTYGVHVRAGRTASMSAPSRPDAVTPSPNGAWADPR